MIQSININQIKEKADVILNTSSFVLFGLECTIDLSKIKQSLKQEFQWHSSQSGEKIEYYCKQWLVSPFLNAMTEPFCYNQCLSRAVQTVIIHPLITRKKQPLTESLIVGIKIAIIGPLLTYALSGVFPKYYNILSLCIINNMLRSLITRILFLSKNKSVFSLMPFLSGILLAGAIRGYIIYNASSTLKAFGISNTDTFFCSMIIRYIFEPQIKKFETLTQIN